MTVPTSMRVANICDFELMTCLVSAAGNRQVLFGVSETPRGVMYTKMLHICRFANYFFSENIITNTQPIKNMKPRLPAKL